MVLDRYNMSSRYQLYQRMDIQDEDSSDSKVRWIYEQYRSGKAITIDDMRYVLSKDPVGGEKVLDDITRLTDDQTRSDNRGLRTTRLHSYCKLKAEQIYHPSEIYCNNEQFFIDQGYTECISKAFDHIRQTILVMDKVELEDMMENLYESEALTDEYQEEYREWQKYNDETERYFNAYDQVITEYRI